MQLSLQNLTLSLSGRGRREAGTYFSDRPFHGAYRADQAIGRIVDRLGISGFECLSQSNRRYWGILCALRATFFMNTSPGEVERETASRSEARMCTTLNSPYEQRIYK